MQLTQLNSQVNIQPIIPSNRYIVARVGRYAVIFADVLVSEILMVSRGSILDLPFYGEAILGVTHHQADIVPLIMARSLLKEDQALIGESLSVIKLSKAADQIMGNQSKHQVSSQKLSGLGIIVDRVVGSLTYDDYQNKKLSRNLNKGLDRDLDRNLDGNLDLDNDLANDLVNKTSSSSNAAANNLESLDNLASLISLPTGESDFETELLSPKNQKSDQIVANIEENEYTPIEIVLSSIPAQMWQPQRWRSPS